MPQGNMVVPLGNLILFSSRQLMPLAPMVLFKKVVLGQLTSKIAQRLKKFIHFIHGYKREFRKRFEPCNFCLKHGILTITLAFSFENNVRKKVFQALIIV